jgi:hypothetical protein
LQAKADCEVGAVQYQCLKDLNEIVVRYDCIRGDCDMFPAAAVSALAMRDIFPVSTRSKKVYSRHEALRGHQIDTVITINPPHGGNRAFNEMSSAGLKISVDRALQVNCSLLYELQRIDCLTFDLRDQVIYLKGSTSQGKRYKTGFPLENGMIKKAATGGFILSEELIDRTYAEEHPSDK